jgi:hypothetical protein
VKISLDANVLVYAVDLADPVKHARAVDIVGAPQLRTARVNSRFSSFCMRLFVSRVSATRLRDGAAWWTFRSYRVACADFSDTRRDAV